MSEYMMRVIGDYKRRLSQSVSGVRAACWELGTSTELAGRRDEPSPRGPFEIIERRAFYRTRTYHPITSAVVIDVDADRRRISSRMYSDPVTV